MRCHQTAVIAFGPNSFDVLLFPGDCILRTGDAFSCYFGLRKVCGYFLLPLLGPFVASVFFLLNVFFVFFGGGGVIFHSNVVRYA